MSAQRVRDWMAAHPDEAAKVRAANRSYVFFRITGLSNDGEPVGAQGVPLTPGRSIAVDRLHEYGTPFFIEADLPIESVKSVSRFGRLMIAQDTGSAVVGPARADLYWGARELDMIAAGRHMPLPVPKPKIAEVEVDKTDGKGGAGLANTRETVAGKHVPVPAPKPKIPGVEVKKADGKGRAGLVNTGETVAGKHPPKHLALPAPKPKVPEIEVKKRDSKGRANSANSDEDWRAAARSGRQAAPARTDYRL
jgi:membrane-bound lytic murein transglycosylase A